MKQNVIINLTRCSSNLSPSQSDFPRGIILRLTMGIICSPFWGPSAVGGDRLRYSKCTKHLICVSFVFAEPPRMRSTSRLFTSVIFWSDFSYRPPSIHCVSIRAAHYKISRKAYHDTDMADCSFTSVSNAGSHGDPTR